jgi:imidazolonepropionase-like amidohydrolase
MFRFPTVRYMGAAAVANGMSYRAALEALTLVPAQVFGVGDRYGSLEAGKQADVVLWTGDPLEPASYAETVLISGVPQPLTSRQTLLRDRYMPKEITR